jgi:ABC-type antimicrobial peptide transport system permease subunit
LGLNIGNNDRVPLALVYVVSIAAAALLTYLLVTAVRARRFELAVMRAVGLSSSGVRWSVAVQATTTAIVPLVVAIPAGVIVGRRAWMSSAHDLDVVRESVTPWLAIGVVVAASVALANLVALIPGWVAVRRSPGRDLRAG